MTTAENVADLQVAIEGLHELASRADQWAGHCGRTGRELERKRATNTAAQYRRAADWLEGVLKKRTGGEGGQAEHG